MIKENFREMQKHDDFDDLMILFEGTFYVMLADHLGLNAASCKSIFQLLMTLSSNGLFIATFFSKLFISLCVKYFKSRNKY